MPAEEVCAELVAAAAEHARRSPGELCDGLMPARDDITVVYLRYPSARGERAEVPRRDLSPGRSVAG
ncbi:hypothetical protein [Amycolatopsis sp. NBC_00438]|uniref:hypothetical protein n=1 Tax=Amycolatopsis sp. NBC_00438 TaxID=2903558 RepID=UPI002E1AD791